MFAGDPGLARFLRGVFHTRPFRDYCLTRGVPIRRSTQDATAWLATLDLLANDRRTRIQSELAAARELSDADGNAHLLAAGDTLPADVPAGAALAFWFLHHRPDSFREVFLHHRSAESHPWRSARGPAGRSVAEMLTKTDRLGEALRAYFAQSGDGFCVVHGHALPDQIWFSAHVADRIQLVEGFTARGLPALHRIRPAVVLIFGYDAADGSIQLQSPLSSADRIGELLRCFGKAVLGAEISVARDLFDLDLLKHPFHPPPDASDMLMARVRALHLRYPARLGRRVLTFETLAEDDPSAIEELLRAHAGDVESLTVTHAELQVRLLIENRPKDIPVRLWRDHCDLDHTTLGKRLRRCLRQWGLCRG